MKDFEKLTDLEIYNLTDENIKAYKRLVLAENGVKFPEKPVEPKEIEAKPDLIVYTIDGLSDKWNGLCFLTIEAAREFVKFIVTFKNIGCIKSSNVDYKIQLFDEGLPKDWHGNVPTLNIQANPVFSNELYKSVEKDIRAYNTQKEKYLKEKESYNAAINKADELTQSILTKIQEVREDIDHKEYLYYKLKEDYLPLAEKDYDIALRFLDKAYNLSDSEKEYIKDKYNKDLTV